jgi:hypothetical protein
VQDFVIQLKDMIKLCPKAKRLNFIGFHKVGLTWIWGRKSMPMLQGVVHHWKRQRASGCTGGVRKGVGHCSSTRDLVCNTFVPGDLINFLPAYYYN